MVWIIEKCCFINGKILGHEAKAPTAAVVFFFLLIVSISKVKC